MSENGFSEKDWKLFRKKVPTWQENYMKRLNEEYMQILMQDELDSTKFWQLEKRIHQDKRKPGVLIDMRRSMMIQNILGLLNDEIITINDLDDFSDELKETINRWLNFRIHSKR